MQMTNWDEERLLAGYREMAADQQREVEAEEWTEGLIGGAADLEE